MDVHETIKRHKGAIPFVYEWGGFPKYAREGIRL